MALQYIQDEDGKTTGVIISLKEWESLKEKYSELGEEVENPAELASWQKKIMS
ncbi:hypothetical protein [Algoriphagus sp.]|uniref:hypothetical protein n=1 Tax=Algoriphagus sp. TaxID=1872435 RepID=UPI00327F6C14